MFDSMPEQSSSTEPKATTPSVDLFGAGTGVDSHTSIERLVSSSLTFLLCHLFFLPTPSWFVLIVECGLVHVCTLKSTTLCYLRASAPYWFLFSYISSSTSSFYFGLVWKIFLLCHAGPHLCLRPVWLVISCLVSIWGLSR